MSQDITCHYYTYVLSDKPSWLNKQRLKVARALELEKYREERVFTVSTSAPELLLKSGNKFGVKKRPTGASEATQVSEAAQFVVLDWHFNFNEGGSNIDASVREVTPSAFASLLLRASDGQKYAIGMATILSPVVIAAFAYVLTSDYPHPISFWELVGGNIRWVVAVSLSLGFLLLDVWALIKLKKKPFVQSVIWAASSLLIFLAPGLWWLVSMPAQPFAVDRLAYIHYLDELRSRTSTAVPIITAAIPWLVIVLNFAGLDRIAKVVEKLSKKDK